MSKEENMIGGRDPFEFMMRVGDHLRQNMSVLQWNQGDNYIAVWDAFHLIHDKCMKPIIEEKYGKAS